MEKRVERDFMVKERNLNEIVNQITEGQDYKPGDQIIFQNEKELSHHHGGNISDSSTHADGTLATKQKDGSWKFEKVHSDD
jgi:hypothetical protein